MVGSEPSSWLAAVHGSCVEMVRECPEYGEPMVEDEALGTECALAEEESNEGGRSEVD